MKQKASPLLIGTFVIGALVLFLAALILFGSGRFFKQSESFILYFDSSLNGLEVGSPVKFRGVTIGEVDQILLRFSENNNLVCTPVIIKIYNDRFSGGKVQSTIDFREDDVYEEQLKRGLKAKLEFQSYVTGRLYIDFDYFPQEATIISKFDNLGFREIPTMKSQMKETWTGVVKTLGKLGKIDFVGISNNVNDSFIALKSSLNNIDFKKISDTIIDTSNSLRERIQSKEIDKALIEMQQCAQNISEVIAKDSPLVDEMESTLKEFQKVAKGIRLLVDYLERNPNALLVGKAPEQQNKKE